MNTTTSTPVRPSRRAIVWLSFPIVGLVAFGAFTFGAGRMKSASPVVDRTAIQVETVRRGPLVRHIEGLGVLVPEETRWLASATPAKVDQIFLRPGAKVKPESVILQLSNPDLDRQLTDSELATKKVEAELANLRVQLQAQLLNERALEAQLQSDATEASLQAERDRLLLAQGLGASMNAKISKARADSLATRLQIEKEKLAIAEEARQSQLAAKQAEVAQVQALYELKMQQKDALLVRAGIAGILEEVSVDAGQQIGAGANLARVTSSEKLMARIHIPESQAGSIQLRQRAVINIQDKKVPGQVMRIDPGVQNGSVNVDVKVDGAQPAGARTELTVDGSIEVERVPNAVYLPKELQVRSGASLPMFKLSDDGQLASRVNVQVGRVSVDGAEIVSGIEPGDRVIVSDMSSWNRYDQVRLR